MKQAIAEITKRLEQRLPDEHAFFTPAGLLEAGLPDFLVARIRLTLRQRLSRSIAPPRVEWADVGVPEAEQAWRQFFSVLHDHVRLPRKRSSQIIEDAVADVLYLICEPREFLPRYIFAGDTVLSLKEARERVEWVVVYPQLGQFLPKYMQARGLEVISRARYENALRQLDDKLVSRYDAGDWLNLLSPLFALFEGQVPARLLQRFFEDKARYGIAERMQQQDETQLSQGLLLSFLSPGETPETPSEDETPHVATTPSAEQSASPKSATENLSLIKQADDDALDTESGPTELNETPETAPSSPDDKTSPAGEEPETAEKPDSLDSQAEEKETAVSEPTEPETESRKQPPPQESSVKAVEIPESEEEPSPENDEHKKEGQGDDDPLAAFLSFEFKSSSKERADEAKEADKSAQNSAPEASEKDDAAEEAPPQAQKDELKTQDTSSETPPKDEDDSPLYARFNGSDDKKEASPKDTEAGTESGEPPAQSRKEQRRSSRQQIPRISPANKEEPEDPEDMPLWKRLSMQRENEEQKDSPPPVSASADETANKNNYKELREFLSPKEQQYVKELYKEDEATYIQDLERLSAFEGWREAGKFITNEIFRKRSINMYGKSAVEFTDQLHKYFLVQKRGS